jgi:hypothetical protein
LKSIGIFGSEGKVRFKCELGRTIIMKSKNTSIRIRGISWGMLKSDRENIIPGNSSKENKHFRILLPDSFSKLSVNRLKVYSISNTWYHNKRVFNLVSCPRFIDKFGT